MKKRKKQEYRRKWYAEHREQEKAASHKWHAEHREQSRAFNRKYRHGHRKQRGVKNRKFKYKCNIKSKATATLHRQLWDNQDDLWLLENIGKITIKEMAIELGRTYFSIQRRLYLLRKELRGE